MPTEIRQMWDTSARTPNLIHFGVSRELSLKFCSTKTQKNPIKEGWMERD